MLHRFLPETEKKKINGTEKCQSLGQLQGQGPKDLILKVGNCIPKQIKMQSVHLCRIVSSLLMIFVFKEVSEETTPMPK